MPIQIAFTPTGWHTHVTHDGVTTACGKPVSEVRGEFGDTTHFTDSNGKTRPMMLEASCRSAACLNGITAAQRRAARVAYNQREQA